MAAILDAAFRVHRALGPGFRESTYQRCLVHALRSDGLAVDEERWMPVAFEGLLIERAYRADLVVNDLVVVEVKAVESLHDVHKAQLIAYLKAGGHPAGVVMNFNVAYFAKGYDRVIHPSLFLR